MILHQISAPMPFGYTAHFSLTDETSISVQCEPDLPRINKPKAQRKLFNAYKRARDAFLADAATALGGSIAMVDVDVRNGQPLGYAFVQPKARH